MNSKLYILIFTSLAFFFLSSPASGQKGRNKYTVQALPAADSVRSSKKSEWQFPFTNINKVYFYNNPEEIEILRKLEEQKNYDALLPLLEAYVSKFGIKNFEVNNNMLWKLGQLYERKGEPTKAAHMFTLAIKNHRGDIKQILQHYDNPDKYVEQNDYVPLDKYYELVEYRSHIDTLIPPRSILLNMGELVNDIKYPDYGPTMNVSGNMLIFTKRKKELTATKLNYRENEELYYTINYDGFWDEAIPFSNVINSHCNEGSATISKDGKTLYFARCKVTDFQYDCRDCLGQCDIYVSYYKDSAWSVPVNLGPNVNTTSWESQPSLSHNEDTLYFASDRLGGFGLSDIWYSHKLPNGQWAPAVNMGPMINTRGNEVSPFYHPKYHVFYFSSNGQMLNFGQKDKNEYLTNTYDIYKSVRIEGKFQEPKNIGPLVNDKGDEYYFTIDANSKDLFYAKSDIDNLSNLDLHSFPLPMEAQPLANVIFRGTLRDSLTNDPFTGIVSVIDLDNGIEVAPKNIRPDGSFEFELNPDNNYLLVITGEDFFRVEERFHLTNDTTVSIQAKNIQYQKFKFQSLEFDNGSAEIKPGMEEDLDKVMNFLLDHPEIGIRISGHTDGQGDSTQNVRLSQKRADAIRNYIINKGKIEPYRVEAFGYGSQRPIVKEESEKDKAINRRVEFEIIHPEAPPGEENAPTQDENAPTLENNEYIEEAPVDE